MRCFIAIGLPLGITGRLASLQQELPQGMRAVKRENMHITLRFLGEIGEEKANAVSDALDSLEFSKFPLECRGLGVFPSRSFIRVLWAGIISQGLEDLHSQLSQKLSALGFKEEKFTPHLTIARARARVNLDTLLEKYAGKHFGTCDITSVRLKRSMLLPTGPVYEDLHRASVKV